jgi:hypothetical protein
MNLTLGNLVDPQPLKLEPMNLLTVLVLAPSQTPIGRFILGHTTNGSKVIDAEKKIISFFVYSFMKALKM